MTVKSSFVQINNKTQCNLTNQQAVKEIGIDLTKRAPGTSQKPLAGVYCMAF